MVINKDKHPEEYGYRSRGYSAKLRTAELNSLAREWFDTPDSTLRERLIVGSQGLVGFVQSQYRLPPHLQRRDLIGEGYVGVIKALDSYEGRGSFTSYAIKLAKFEMSAYRRRNFKIVRPSDKAIKEVLREQYAGLESDDAFLEKARRTMYSEVLNYNSKMDLRISKEESRAEDLESVRKIRFMVRNAIENANLDKHELRFVEARYFSKGEKVTLETLGKEFSKSKERVRQIGLIALRKIEHQLRKNSEELEL
jgi:RNA polymerase sigma factor (sigma-70 family)